LSRGAPRNYSNGLRGAQATYKSKTVHGLAISLAKYFRVRHTRTNPQKSFLTFPKFRAIIPT